MKGGEIMYAIINNVYKFETDILGYEATVHVNLTFDTDYDGNHYTFHVSPKNKNTIFIFKLQYKRGNGVYKLLMNKLKELIEKGKIKEVYYDREKRQLVGR